MQSQRTSDIFAIFGCSDTIYQDSNSILEFLLAPLCKATKGTLLQSASFPSILKQAAVYYRRHRQTQQEIRFPRFFGQNKVVFEKKIDNLTKNQFLQCSHELFLTIVEFCYSKSYHLEINWPEIYQAMLFWILQKIINLNLKYFTNPQTLASSRKTKMQNRRD